MALLIGGRQVDVEVHGEGRPLVVIHGLTGDRRLLVETCEPVLAQRGDLRRIYVDLPGHGGSPAHLDGASADGLLDTLVAVVASLAPEGQPLLLGYAYGAYLVQGLLAVVEARAAMLVCPVIEPDFAKRTCPPRRIARRDPALRYGDDPHERETFDEVAVVQTQALLEAYRRAIYPASRVADRRFVDEVRARYVLSRPYMAALHQFAGPLDVVCGRDDHWVGCTDALRLVAAAPRGSFHVLADCGHLLPLEQPERFAALLADWVARATV